MLYIVLICSNKITESDFKSDKDSIPDYEKEKEEGILLSGSQIEVFVWLPFLR